MRPRARAFRVAALVALIGAAAPVAASEVRAVIELFTSQGSSACPPADRVLGELSSDPQLVALSLPVDYWDYLGWRDTLALNAHTLRQKGYAEARRDRPIYTPQVVGNGVVEANGGTRAVVEKLIAKAEIKSPLSVPVTLTQSETNIEVEVGSGGGPHAAIWALAVAKLTPVTIKRGENRGKTVHYYNVVRSWTRLADWKGEPVKLSVSISELAQTGADAVAVIVQGGSVEAPGPIRGAAMIPFR